MRRHVRCRWNPRRFAQQTWFMALVLSSTSIAASTNAHEQDEETGRRYLSPPVAPLNVAIDATSQPAPTRIGNMVTVPEGVPIVEAVPARTPIFDSVIQLSRESNLLTADALDFLSSPDLNFRLFERSPKQIGAAIRGESCERRLLFPFPGLPPI